MEICLTRFSEIEKKGKSKLSYICTWCESFDLWFNNVQVASSGQISYQIPTQHGLDRSKKKKNVLIETGRPVMYTYFQTVVSSG